MVFVMIVTLAGIGTFYGYRLYGGAGAALGAVAGAVLGTVAGLVTRHITSAVGGGTGDAFFSGRRPKWTLREQLSADLSQAKHHKRQENFNQALRKANEILEKDPNFPEALLLKAEVLWEGFENAGAAKKYLQMVMEKTPDSGSLYGQAASLYEELTKIEKIKQMHS